MRLNINLASRKYEDVQQFFVRWITALSILSVLTVTLAVLAYLKHHNATKAEAQSKDLQQQIAALDRELKDAIAKDNLPENKDITQQKKFWNLQITKKSFSWTLLLNDMQKIMPKRAYLESVQPELTPDHRLKLRLVIVGEKRADALELIEKMENSNRFHSTRITRETAVKESKPGAAPTYKYEIETFYTPASAPASSSPAQNQRAQQTSELHVTRQGQ